MTIDFYWKQYDGRGRICERCRFFSRLGWRMIGYPKRLMPFFCSECSPNSPGER